MLKPRYVPNDKFKIFCINKYKATRVATAKHTSRGKRCDSSAFGTEARFASLPPLAFSSAFPTPISLVRNCRNTSLLLSLVARQSSGLDIESGKRGGEGGE